MERGVVVVGRVSVIHELARISAVHVFPNVGVSVAILVSSEGCGEKHVVCVRNQHLIVLRLTPCRSLAMTFLMDSLAKGTLHAVLPTSTFTSPIFAAAACAFAASG